MVYFGFFSFVLACIGAILLREGDMGGSLFLLPLFLLGLWSVRGDFRGDFMRLFRKDRNDLL